MHKIYFIATLAVLCGCTLHQEEKIRELLTVERGAFPRVKDTHLVQESLRYPSDRFYLEIKSADPLSTSKGIFPVWILKGENIPLEERFIFAVVDKVTGKIEPQYEFEILENGKLKIFGKEGIRIENEVPFVETGHFSAGSPLQYVIVSKEDYTSAIVEFTPYPIVASGANGEQLEIESTHPMGTHFLLKGHGFLPLEELRFTHVSGDALEEIEVIADEAGNFITYLNPTVFGRLGGEAKILVTGNNREINFDYPWGARLEKRGFEEKSLFPILFVVNREQSEMNSLEIQDRFASLKNF